MTPSPSTSAPSSAELSSLRERNVRLGDLLVQRGLISPQKLQELLELQRQSGAGKLLGELVVEQKLVSPEQVMEVLAEAYGIPFARVHPRLADPKVVQLLPRDFLQRNTVLPMFLVRGRLTVAVHEPANLFLIEEIERMTGCSVQIVAATAQDIRATLETYLPAANVFVIDQIVGDIQEDDIRVVESDLTDLSSLEQGASDSPVIRLVNYLIYAAVQEGASDIHLEPGDHSFRVRFRVDGVLFEKLRPPYQMHPAVVSRIKIMAGLDISERRVPQDGSITVLVDRRPIDLRVSTMPGKFGEKLVLRILDKRRALTDLAALGFSPSMLQHFRQVIHKPHGIVLVTGPTGSGKSTTLYAALHEIMDDSINISTVEDPIEYTLPGVNQFQVNEKVGFTFAAALRALLRQDPDIIMVGEIRDAETARIAIQAALTGHLVLSTLHTNDAPSAVTRLFNIGLEPYLVAASLRAVLAQRLLRRICPDCKEQQPLTPATAAMLRQLAPSVPPLEKLWIGKGCPRCRNTGYSGRIGIFELLVPDEPMLQAIAQGAPLAELRRLAQATGFVRLFDDGLEKVRLGLTTLQELLSATETD